MSRTERSRRHLKSVCFVSSMDLLTHGIVGLLIFQSLGGSEKGSMSQADWTNLFV